ncbi:hypothetical protein AOXY_G29847 [Acipenser oxyrinchus oxyrinchus]|uniref:Uncharacterized protein n=1 Tax=Acipenser oxyrinchus oxyrinchus TaxID=40147 RepID=A0AAD8CM12_ACIOX|nr:hypothetical protein AOXY_G29847 [Acipenser oxyrinchus oxyrinchus]
MTCSSPWVSAQEPHDIARALHHEEAVSIRAPWCRKHRQLLPVCRSSLCMLLCDSSTSSREGPPYVSQWKLIIQYNEVRDRLLNSHALLGDKPHPAPYQ